MKTSVLYIIIISTLLTVLLSCNKENPCTRVIVSNIDEYNRKMALSPFTGTDTLKFLYNNKDTQIYVGQGVQSGWQYVYGGDPTLCDKKYEYLIYNYNCINVPDFYFRIEYHQQGVSYRGFLKNVYVGEYEIEATKDDSIYINNNWYYEPYYISNGPDTMQYFMLCNRVKNPDARIIKIKYLYNELTLIK